MAIQYPNPQLSFDQLAAAERTKQNAQKGVSHPYDIYIDTKQGTVPLTCLYDCANNLLRMSKDGQRVIIQNHSATGSVIITLTRVSMGNFKEEVNFEIQPVSK
jgi:hypothetical protein